MKHITSYQNGQRWRLQAHFEGFEDSLVIGGVYQWGPEQPWYTVYIQYAPSVHRFIRPDKDGVILTLREGGLDRSVSELLESDVQLPWWWIHGRRYLTPEDAPTGTGQLRCENVADALTSAFEGEKLAAAMLRQRANEIEKHFKRYKAKKSTRGKSGSVRESWQRITTWFVENTGTPMPLNPGASREAIAAFEQMVHVHLPEDFVESLRTHDGGNCSLPPVGGDFLSLRQIEEQWKMYCSWLEIGEYAIGNDWIPSQIVGPIKPVFWNPKRIYITDNSGDHLALDLDPPDDGRYGQIIDHSHEVGPTGIVASSWSEFICHVADDLEIGKYIVFENGELELLESFQPNLNCY